MCDILHLRQTKLWLRSDVVFHFTKYGKLQKKLLDTIHGLTKKVRNETTQKKRKEKCERFIFILIILTQLNSVHQYVSNCNSQYAIPMVNLRLRKSDSFFSSQILQGDSKLHLRIS